MRYALDSCIHEKDLGILASKLDGLTEGLTLDRAVHEKENELLFINT